MVSNMRKTKKIGSRNLGMGKRGPLKQPIVADPVRRTGKEVQELAKYAAEHGTLRALASNTLRALAKNKPR